MSTEALIQRPRRHHLCALGPWREARPSPRHGGGGLRRGPLCGPKTTPRTYVESNYLVVCSTLFFHKKSVRLRRQQRRRYSIDICGHPTRSLFYSANTHFVNRRGGAGLTSLRKHASGGYLGAFFRIAGPLQESLTAMGGSTNLEVAAALHDPI